MGGARPVRTTQPPVSVAAWGARKVGSCGEVYSWMSPPSRSRRSTPAIEAMQESKFRSHGVGRLEVASAVRPVSAGQTDAPATEFDEAEHGRDGRRTSSDARRDGGANAAASSARSLGVVLLR